MPATCPGAPCGCGPWSAVWPPSGSASSCLLPGLVPPRVSVSGRERATPGCAGGVCTARSPRVTGAACMTTTYLLQRGRGGEAIDAVSRVSCANGRNGRERARACEDETSTSATSLPGRQAE